MRLTIAAALFLVLTFGLTSAAHAAGGPNLSLGKAASASSTNGSFVAGNLNDGNQATYWEGAGSSFPQWGQVDLGTPTSVDQVVLKLPSGWGSRTETLSVQVGTDGSTFTPIVPASGRVFDPASGNTVTINFTPTTTRYVRVNITANTGWAAAQLSEASV